MRCKINISLWTSYLFIPVIAVSVSCHQIILEGYPYGHDWIFELVRIREYLEAWKAGQFVPYWSNNLYHGFGSPVFTFYAPLYSATSAVILFFGFSITTAAIVTLVFFSLLATFGIILLARELIGDYSNPASIVATRVVAVTYVLAPYFLSNMLLRNASAEFIALCLLPYPLWGLVRVYKEQVGGCGILTLGLSLIILAHNLTALIMVTILTLLTFFLFIPEKRYHDLKVVLISQIIAVGMTCWFWLPAFGLKVFIRVSELQVGKLDFHNNFKQLYELFNYENFYSIGLLPFIIPIYGIYSLKDSKEYWRIRVLLVIASAFFLFLQTSASLYLWEHLPFMSLFQFPWRMMGPFTILYALLLGILFKLYANNLRFMEIVIISFIVLNALPQFHKYKVIPENISEQVPLITTAYQIRKLGLPITVGDEYLPTSANKRLVPAILIDEPVYFESNPATVKIIANEGSFIHLSVNVEQYTTLNFARWYFPGWKAEVDDQEYKIQKNKAGSLKLDLDTGTHEVKVWLSPTNWRVTGFVVSALFMTLFIFLSFYRYRAIKNLL